MSLFQDLIFYFDEKFKMKVGFDKGLFIISEIIKNIQLRVKEDKHQLINNAVNP
jgi:hypothetical protein